MQKKKTLKYQGFQSDILGIIRHKKAVDGFEPTIKLLQSRALPLGYTAITDIILP